MKLEKAIKDLGNLLTMNRLVGGTAQDDALKLLIEAGKEVERLRRIERFDPTIMLPGETKE